MKEKLQKIKEEATRQIQASQELSKLNEVRVAFLGKKGGAYGRIKEYEGRAAARPSGSRAACK